LEGSELARATGALSSCANLSDAKTVERDQRDSRPVRDAAPPDRPAKRERKSDSDARCVLSLVLVSVIVLQLVLDVHSHCVDVVTPDLSQGAAGRLISQEERPAVRFLADNCTSGV
jgi:hypothetical protein